ncbi:17428_t:CDS:1, partial [Gigaspora rosea]
GLLSLFEKTVIFGLLVIRMAGLLEIRLCGSIFDLDRIGLT